MRVGRQHVCLKSVEELYQSTIQGINLKRLMVFLKLLPKMLLSCAFYGEH